MSAQGFVDPYNYQPFSGSYGQQVVYDSSAEAQAHYGKDYVASGDTFWQKLGDFFSGTDTKAAYENWKTERDRDYERQATNSARAWDLYMDSTKVQRLMKDIEAAGLNPWLALQSGGAFGTSNTNTAGQGGSARAHSESRKQTNLSGIAMLLIGTAKLFAALA